MFTNKNFFFNRTFFFNKNFYQKNLSLLKKTLLPKKFHQKTTFNRTHFFFLKKTYFNIKKNPHKKISFAKNDHQKTFVYQRTFVHQRTFSQKQFFTEKNLTNFFLLFYNFSPKILLYQEYFSHPKNPQTTFFIKKLSLTKTFFTIKFHQQLFSIKKMLSSQKL